MKQHLKQAEILANLLDSQFSLGNIKFGASAIIDLVPGIGDFLDLILGSYLIWIAYKAKIPSTAQIHMVGNLIIAYLVGLFPVLGDFFSYVYFRPNRKNLEILKKHFPNIIEGEIV